MLCNTDHFTIKRSAEALLTTALDLLEADLRETFRDTGFAIQDSTAEEKLENLVEAIINLNRGRKLDLYKPLR